MIVKRSSNQIRGSGGGCIRQLLGYDGLENPALIEEVNILYVKAWEPLHNYFMPNEKIIDTKTH